jgi:hypothetical protein
LSETSEKPSDLVSVTDYLEIIKFFDEGARAKAGMSVWTKASEAVASCNIISLSQAEKMIYTTALTATDSKKMYADLKAADESCFLNVKLERATIFFTSKLESNSFSNLQFTLPKKIFKVQRRQQQRFKILQGYVLRVSFLGPIDPLKELKQKIYDVSSGGLSFLVENSETAVFQPGSVLKNMTFTIRNIEFKLAGEIIHCKPVIENALGQNQNKTKVGIKFVEIDSKSAGIIDEYVFEENRKFYSRFM